MNERDIFTAARQLQGAAEQDAFLDEACASDQELRCRIVALLEEQAQLGSFLEHSNPPAVTVDDSITERIGTVIGPYKLLEQIGEGGMGTVWMAQQTEPVKRLVAIKLIKAGMDSKQVIARFEAERQALALMDHPNIAKVLDGGATAADRPYFVMDLVKGAPITRYCDEHRLTPRQRLELFVPVCQAIQHAHQKGIIHRDLKPSNVLVAPFDGEAVVKVIDFGVAKAAGQQLTDCTLVTGFGAVVGTPEYMSPEQAELNNRDIDTRSDIYTLGVLLYELLVGSPPFSRKELEKPGMLEMLRVIREQEPTKPSTKLSTAEGLPTLAANRGTEPAKLTRLVRGELDWIVMKALEKNRNRRYETANSFAMDVQRYLADEPVLACPPSAGYRLRKYARKHKRVLVTAGVFAALLVAAAGTGVALASWAVRERGRAEERQRAAEANLKSALAAVDQMLTRVGDATLVNVPQMEPVRRELLQDALRFYQKLLSQETNNAVIQSELAIAYRRMGNIQFLLGQVKEAEESYRQAVTLGEQLLAESPDEPATLDNLADTHKDLGAFYSEQARWSQAETALKQGVALRGQLQRLDPAGPENRGKLAGIHATLVSLYRFMGQLDQAEAAFRTCQALMEDLLSRDAKNVRYLLTLGACHQNVALVYHAQDRAAEAEAANLKALDLYQQVVRDQPEVVDYQKRLARVYNNLGLLYAREGKHSKADAAYQQSVALHEAILRDHPKVVAFQVDVAACYGNMAHHVRQSRSAEESLPWTTRTIDMVAPVLEKDPLNRRARAGLFDVHLARTMALRKLGRDEEAVKDWKRALELSAGQSDITMRLWRPSCLAHLGDHVQAATEMETLLTEGRAQPVNLFQFGCYYALCSAAVAQDARLPSAERAKLADQYGRRGVELLRRAQAGGYFRDPARLTRMRENKDLDAARERQDFKTFLAELEAMRQESRAKNQQSEKKP
jgi:serine/threonine protein kinase/Flp pilus assembly protein TadD